MAKLNRATVVAEALDLLDEVGLDAVSTRQLAKRLGVEQPSLYYHFRKKEDLLGAMAEAAMAPHTAASLPTSGDDWHDWFLDNMRSFRRMLLSRRDGARLHAGTRPGPVDLDRLEYKMAFLVASGVPEWDAHMAMLAASQFAVGAVLEEQADPGDSAALPLIDHESAFEAGLALIVDGLAQRVPSTQAPTRTSARRHPLA